MNILLAATGSISVYKTYDIARGLINAGHTVRVVLTSGALQFIKPDTFYYLGVEKTYLPLDDFNIEQKVSNVLHIELVDWLDLLIVAPLSANTMAKFSNGEAPDLLCSIFLALNTKPCVLFPAMNTRMLNAPATQRNLQFLASYNNIWIHPSSQGELACGDVGEGKLPTAELIIEAAPTWLLASHNKRVVITTGATISRLDPVRYLTNPSSGLTGYYLAKTFLQKGFKVDLICGLNSTKNIEYLRHHPNCTITRVESTRDLETAVQNKFNETDIYISAAAINDIEFDQAPYKIKKSDISETLKIKKAPDVLSNLLSQKRSGQIMIGFAAETGDDTNLFLKKWENKKVDLLIGNFVDARIEKGFQSNSNEYYFVNNGKLVEQQFLTKEQLANKIIENIL